MQIKSYYSRLDRNSDEYEKYTYHQIKRSKKKTYKHRSAKEYEICFAHIEKIMPHSPKILCLGTRNNYERDVFARLVKAYDGYVCSQDICEKSEADLIGDFNFLSELTDNRWDIIYSNAIDHAISPSAAFFEWLKVLQPGGIMVLGFILSAENEEVKPADCNIFTFNSVFTFMSKQNEIKVIDIFEAKDYFYWVVKKV